MPKKMVVRAYSYPYVRAWDKLEAFVKERRKVTGQSNWCIDFERRADVSRQYNEHLAKTERPRVIDSTSNKVPHKQK
jgi:hypothetical protein